MTIILINSGANILGSRLFGFVSLKYEAESEPNSVP